MNDSINDDLESALNNIGTSMSAIEKLYPKIHSSFMPLSITGVSARTYLHWKKSGLIFTNNVEEEQRSWVRINLIDYIWIKIIQTMRDFGVPLEVIKQSKEMMYSSALDILINDRDNYFEFLRQESNISKEKLDEAKRIVDLYADEYKNIPEEFEMYYTIISTLVTDMLIKNDKASLIITKNEGEFDVSYFTYKTMNEFQHIVFPLLERPHIQIPLRKLIQDFFDDPKSEKFVGGFELLNLKEKKVIDAIRKNDFKEIIIKQDGGNKDIIIEVEKDGAIMDQKAKEIKRILGLNEYSEVTIKFRNDKHLYFKNKTRLK